MNLQGLHFIGSNGGLAQQMGIPYRLHGNVNYHTLQPKIITPHHKQHKSPHPQMIISSHPQHRHHISPHHQVIISPHHQVIISPHHQVIISPHHQVIISPHHSPHIHKKKYLKQVGWDMKGTPVYKNV
jgi:hypothetical protein